jgi:hypothetical protein
LYLGVIPREEASMTTHPTHDWATSRRLMAEAREQRSRELRAAAFEILGKVRWKGGALVGVACLIVVGVAACAG